MVEDRAFCAVFIVWSFLAIGWAAYRKTTSSKQTLPESPKSTPGFCNSSIMPHGEKKAGSPQFRELDRGVRADEHTYDDDKTDAPLALETQGWLGKPFSLQPPPLTPPTLYHGHYVPENRRSSDLAPMAKDVDHSFFNQPNPDYASAVTPSALASSLQRENDCVPQRRSYTRLLRFDGDDSVRSIDPSRTELSSSPVSQSSLSDSGFVAPETSPREIELEGEILSVMDDSGVGWKRHIRVYGGGVCPACEASSHDDQAMGGFYGTSVPLEERRI